MARYRRLNELDPRWTEVSDEYYVCDEGYLCRIRNGEVKILKSSYYRSKQYPYQQVHQSFGAKSGKQIGIKVHYAVALAFCEREDGQTDVDHINNEKTDNRAVNLQWLTHAENLEKKRTDRLFKKLRKVEGERIWNGSKRQQDVPLRTVNISSVGHMTGR